MPTPPSPITIPNSLTYRSVAGRTLPLSNLELDRNFAYVENLAEQRLLIGDFTAANIISKLNSNSLSSSPGGVNASEVRGYYPADDNVGNTLVLRNSNGNFSANIITANTFNGNASTATLATSAVRLQTPRTINGVSFDGQSNITIADSTRVLKAGDTMTGKLTLPQPTTSTASLRLQVGVNPTSPVEGDVWVTNEALNIRLGGVTRSLAFTSSNISGFAANVSGIVGLANGGTGATNADTARNSLNAAKRGVNSDITQLTGLTVPISVAQGGTGLTSPGPVGNVLKSNGTGWVSQPDDDDADLYFSWGFDLPVTFFSSLGGTLSNITNYYDVFPPVGYTMDDFSGISVSLARVFFQNAPASNSNIVCTWEKFPTLNPNRIRIMASATSQRNPARINYHAVWWKR